MARGRMTESEEKPEDAPEKKDLPEEEEASEKDWREALGEKIAPIRKRLRPYLRRAKRTWGKLYGPWGRASAKFLDHLASDDRRRRIAAALLAFSLNLILLTVMSVFAKVRIWIPNAPSDTINITLVEMLPRDLELRDPEIAEEPEPEPEPEIIEEPEPEPEPEPVPEPEPEPEPAPPPQPEPEPEPEPEIIEEPLPEIEPEPEPEPEIELDLEPEFAPPAEEPEPLIPEPEPAIEEDDLVLPEPEEEVVEQTPEEEAPEPLVSVEPETQPEPGLEELVGDEEGEGEDAAEEEGEGEEPEEEEPVEETVVEETPPQNDDMFDEEPSFTGRRFVLPQVQLPTGEAAIDPGSSGVIAIYCPDQFTDAEKIAECAGRPEIRSGWRPGTSGEDWTRARELLNRDRASGNTSPTYGPAADSVLIQRGNRQVEELRDFRRSQDNVNRLPDSTDDNLMRGVEGNRPGIGPEPFEPNWTLRELPEGMSQEDIEELRRQLEEDGESEDE